MDLPVNPFKRMLASGRLGLGSWLMSGAPSTAEALGCAGFDFVVVDMEHVPIDTPQMVEQLRAIAGTPAAPVTRVPWNDMVMVKRALDGGAQTLMLPFVQSAAEAARAVSYTRYPPDGVRGFAGVHRASRFGLVSDYAKRAATELCVIVQIETAAALDELEAIAAVPGVDSVFIGPGDLAASMGHLGNIQHPEVLAKLEWAATTLRGQGKPAGVLGPGPELATKLAGYGFNWIAIGTDMSFMIGRAQEWLGKVRGEDAARPPGSAY
jgi:2-dehydro-3-deoxyglucarate aldolase/4-hydroxy-2-oxoheptanedioate aldolase